MAQDDGKKKQGTAPESAAADVLVPPVLPAAGPPAVDGPAPDPVGDAERALEEAKRALDDAKDGAKRDDEVAKAKEQYRTEQAHLEADDAVLRAQLSEGKESLAATQQEKAAVNAIKHEYDDDGSELRLAFDQLLGQLAAERGKLDTAKADLDSSKKRFEGIKAQGKGVQAKHREADVLRKEGFDALVKQKRHLAYFLLRHRLQPAIDAEPKPLETAAYNLEIESASKAYGDKTKEVRNFELSIKDLEKKLADAEKALADFVKKRDAQIRERLAALN